MKVMNKAILISALGIFSLSAHAEHLSAQQCNSYPFVKLSQPVTHDQLMQELAELEADGYDPSADNNAYPDDIQSAEQQLHHDYRRDCSGSSTAMN